MICVFHHKSLICYFHLPVSKQGVRRMDVAMFLEVCPSVRLPPSSGAPQCHNKIYTHAEEIKLENFMTGFSFH